MADETTEKQKLLDEFYSAVIEGRISEVTKQLELVNETGNQDDLVLSADKDGHSALHLAARHAQLDISTLLLERKVDVNAIDKKGRTPLHHAAKVGSKDMAALLLENGAMIDAVDCGDMTSLHLAAREGKTAIVKLLVDSGANCSLRDKNDMGAISYAKNKDILELLTRALVNHYDRQIMTILQHTVAEGNLTSVKYFVSRGADINQPDFWGRRPIHYAVQEGHLSIALYLVERGAHLKGLSHQLKVELLKFATDSDLHIDDSSAKETVYQVLYKTIKLNNADLFDTLFNLGENVAKVLEGMLGEVYEDLRCKNILLLDHMAFAVQDRLIDSRFFADKKDSSAGEVHVSLDLLLARREMVCQQIDRLCHKYVNKDACVDNEFIITSRCLAQNIRLLKRQLKSTYNRLPWEEIELCLALFITCHTRLNEFNAVCMLVLDKERLLVHLKNFNEKLAELSIEESDLSRGFPKPEDRNLSARQNVIKSVIQLNPSFKQLFNDCEIIRSVNSLKRIESYVQLATTIDLTANRELGTFVIERTLQIIGESLKNTLESPNVSDSIHDLLLLTAPKDVKEIVVMLRDSLSHAHTLTKKMEIEEGDDTHFERIQNDLKKFQSHICDILYARKTDAIRLFLKKVVASHDLEHVKQLASGLKNLHLGHIELNTFNATELEKTKDLMNKLRHSLAEMTEEEMRICQTIDKRISLEETRLRSRKECYVHCALSLSSIQILIRDGKNNLPAIQNASNICLHYIWSKTHSTMFKEVLPMLQTIVTLRTHADNLNKIQELFYQLSCAIQFEVGRVKGINYFQDILQRKCVTKTCQEVETQVQDYFTEIQKTITLDNEKNKDILKDSVSDRDMIEFDKEIKKMRVIYQNKQQLIHRCTRKKNWKDLIKGIDIEELGIKLKAEKNLESWVNSGEWSKSSTYLGRLNDSYGKFVTDIFKMEGFMSISKLKDSLTTLLKSSKIHDVQKIVDTFIKLSIKQLVGYFEKRLKKLEQLFPYSDNKFELFEEYRGNKPQRAAIEMLVLDLLEVLENVSILAENRLFLDDYSPSLIGKSLRNYLAHGDPLIDTQPFDVSVAIFCTAQKLIYMGREIFSDSNKLIGYNMNTSMNHLKNRQIKITGIIDMHNEMFEPIKRGRFHWLNDCLDRGADLRARDLHGWSCLHFAAKFDSPAFHSLDENFNNYTKDCQGWDPLHVAAVYGSKNMLEYFAATENVGLNGVDRVMKTLEHLSAENGNVDVLKILIEKYRNIGVRDSLGEAPLHLAAQNGHTAVVKKLLEVRAPVDVRTQDGWTPLHWAAQEGHYDVVHALLDNNAMMEATTDDNRTPLHLAAAGGHHNIVLVLLEKGAQVNTCTKNNVTPLYLAAKNGHSQVVQLLLERGAIADISTLDDKATPLHVVAQNNHQQVASLLLKNEPSLALYATAKFGLTPLHIAASSGHLSLVELLLSKEVALLNIIAETDLTPLHLAAQNGHQEVVSLLLDRGAKVDCLAIEHETPLHWAAEEGHDHIVQTLLSYGANVMAVTKSDVATPLHLAAEFGHLDVAKTLLENKAWVNAQSYDNVTPLHLAVREGMMDLVLLLLENNADVNMRTSRDETQLHFAAHQGHHRVAEVLLKHYARVDDESIHRWTPLHYAAANGHMNMVNLLLKNNADANVKGREELTPLHLAAQNGHQDIVEVLLKKANVNDCNINGYSPLHFASRQGHLDVATILLENGACINVETIDRGTPLHLAAENGHLQVVIMLLKWGGARLDVLTERDGGSPLHMAAGKGHHKIVKALLENSASVAIAGKQLWMPLHLAIQNNHIMVVTELLKNGAEANAADINNWTPLHLAAQGGCLEAAKLLLKNGAHVDECNGDKWTSLQISVAHGHDTLVSLLLENKANPNVFNSDHWTLLHFAAYGGHTNIVTKLLNINAHVDALTKDNLTPLHMAVQEGHKDVVLLLLDGKANVDAVNEVHQSPLHYAVQKGHCHIVSVLLNHEANTEALDVSRCTPLHWAAQYGHTDIVQQLLIKGADFLAKNIHHETVLHWAVNSNNEILIKMVIGKIQDTFEHDLLMVSQHINAVDSEGNTPLLWAAHHVKIVAVRLLLECNVDTNAQNNKGRTALHGATKIGCWDIVQLLVAHQADVGIKDSEGNTPLDFAKENLQGDVISHKNVQLIISLLTKSHASFQNPCKSFNLNNHELSPCSDIQEDVPFVPPHPTNHQPMSSKTHSGKKLVEWLSQHGMSAANPIDEFGRTCLHLSANYGDLETVQWLVEQEGADVHFMDKAGRTALHMTAPTGKLEALQWLVTSGKANINATDNDGDTVLHIATKLGNLKMVTWLLQHGADVLASNNHETVLHLAVSSLSPGVVEEILKKIMDFPSHDSHINAADGEGDTPLMWACETGNMEAVKMLLDCGANPNIQNQEGMTALHWATNKNRPVLVQQLIDKGGNANILDNSGRNPLALAAENLPQTEICQEDADLIKALLISVTDIQ